MKEYPWLMEAFQVVKMSFKMEYNQNTLKITIFVLFPFSLVKIKHEYD